MSNQEHALTVVEPDDDTGADEVLGFAARILQGTLSGVVQGAAGTAEDALRGCARLVKGDVRGAADIVGRRVVGMAVGAVETVKSGVCVVEAGAKSVVRDELFMTPTNEAHITRLCQTGVYVATGTLLTEAVTEGGTPEGTGCALNGDACALPGVDNGVFDGNEAELRQLIAAGEDPTAEPVPASEVTRSAEARAAFLDAHGLDNEPGWEVHHVMPLSAGGEDVPENMVLVDEETHDRITAEHHRYYDWSRNGR